jgi:hypothetical protein
MQISELKALLLAVESWNITLVENWNNIIVTTQCTVFPQIKDNTHFTIFSFQENTCIHISQDFMSACVLSILELNNHHS